MEERSAGRRGRGRDEERGAERRKEKEQWGPREGRLEGGAEDREGQGEVDLGKSEPEGENVAGQGGLQLAGRWAGPHLHL